MSLFAWLFALSYSSWALLCLGLPRHFQQHFGRLPGPTTARSLRAGGWLVMLAAYASGVWLRGWGIGSVDFTAAWMLAAIAWVLLQAYQRGAARWLAPTSTALAAIALLSQ